MPSITEDINSPAKILLIGKSGAGKTGSLASLVATGYNLRIVDTDKGVRSLRSLLTDPHYAYAKIIAAKGIDLNTAVRYIPIDTSMKLRSVQIKIGSNPDRFTSQTLLAPTNAKAWNQAIELLCDWKEEDGTNLGPISTWGLQDVLVIDSFSTLAKCAYYFSQSLNGRLGSRDQGFDYQRDIGEAQSQLTRLLELLYDSTIQCNIVVISHITWVDESRGIANRPSSNETVISTPDGYPSAIGRALSPQMGKYFNDVFIVSSSGTGGAVQRTISTVPKDGVGAKNSVYMERDYPVTSGLAQIFAAIRGQPVPSELLDAVRPIRQVSAMPAPGPTAPSGPVLERRTPAVAPV